MCRKHRILAGMLAAAALLSSCTLLPEEETVQTAPVIRGYEREEYDLTQVCRGDMILTEKISCRYVPVQTIDLSFGIPGEYVDEIFVQPGDLVEQGQLLAQLQLGDLPVQMKQSQFQEEELQLRLNHIEASHEIELRRFEIEHAHMELVEKSEALKALEEAYSIQHKALEDEMYLQRMALVQMQEELEQRQIRAPFTGRVTYTRKYQDGDMSVQDQRVLTLADSSMSLFRAETENWDRFVTGDEYEITVGEKRYPAVVISEEMLSLPIQQKETGKSAYVYFSLKEVSFELDDNEKGFFELELDRHMDTLYVDKAAIMKAGDKRIVYYQTQDGLKAYKEVSTGLVVGEYVEILDGLSEGEFVIVD